MSALWLILIVPVSACLGMALCGILWGGDDDPASPELNLLRKELEARRVAMAWARKACTTALSVQADAGLYRGVLKQVSMALGDGNPMIKMSRGQ